MYRFSHNGQRRSLRTVRAVFGRGLAHRRPPEVTCFGTRVDALEAAHLNGRAADFPVSRRAGLVLVAAEPRVAVQSVRVRNTWLDRLFDAHQPTSCPISRS